MPEAFAMVKVGNSECELAKFTPWSRTAAMVGALCGVTDSARRPSGMNMMTLRGGCAPAAEICSPMSRPARPRMVLKCDITVVLLMSFFARARYEGHKT